MNHDYMRTSAVILFYLQHKRDISGFGLYIPHCFVG